MRNHFSIGRPNSRPSGTVRDTSSGHISDSETSQPAQDPKHLQDSTTEEPTTTRKGIFARPWSRRQIGIFSSLLFLALGLVAIIIALPIIFTRKKNTDTGDTYHLYHSNHDDPSYRIHENRPVFGIQNFPDPGLLHYNGTWYTYGTNPKKHDPNSIHIPVATSTNFVNWTLHHDYDAMPTLGGWERSVNHWAPDVIQRNDGKFIIYYAGQTKNFKTHHCVGAAISESIDPLGPYKPLNKPLACPHKYGGAIDPSPFKDKDGKLYLVYKADGNSVGSGGYCGNSKIPRKPVPLVLQELHDDGITKIGEPKAILDIDDSDGPLIEAPNIIRADDGTYYLFFSSHCFTSLGYNVKYAHSKSIMGPYTRAERPLLQTTDFDLKAPGGATISEDGTKMVFHAECDRWRCMYASGIDIRSGNNTIVLSSLDIVVSSGNHSANASVSS